MLSLRTSVILRSWWIVPVGLLSLALAGNAQATTIESFDSDPGWQGAGNTSGFNSFGYSNTNFAGGVAHEAGGPIASRTNGFDWYADTDLGASYTLVDALAASGKFTVESISGLDGGFEVGFFHKTGTDTKVDGGIAEGLMMRIIDLNSTQVRVQFRMGGNYAGTILQLNAGSDYTFNLGWNPTAINPLTGTATLAINTAGGGSVGTLSIDHDNDGWVLDSFGITTLNFGANRQDGASFYMDNLSYTSAVPEPSA